MTVYEVATQRRTIRKYTQNPIPRSNLERYINAARLAPSGSNMQPLKYAIIDTPELVQQIFDTVKWAGYISPAGNPGEGERPTAFIIVLADLSVRPSGYEMDAGAAIQNILLTAWEDGIASCWMGAIDRKAIKTILGAGEEYAVLSAIALGYPGENSVTEDLKDSIKYWKDESGTYHVPKRSLEEVLFKR